MLFKRAMGIKNFFKKIGNGLKKAGRFIKNKVFPVIGRLAKPIFNVMGAIPGKIGLIGQIGSGVSNILHGATQNNPNTDVKDKLNRIIDRGNNAFQTVVDKGQNVANAANTTINTGKDVYNEIRNGIKKLPIDPGFYKK